MYQYGQMLRSAARIDGYVRAVKACVRPGDAVVDLGTGFGFFAVIACQAGARRVYAIEPNSAVLVGSEFARRNGCQEKIEFIRAPASDVDLPERVDVVVSDLRGSLPVHGRHFEVLADVRGRMLRPGGTLIPGRDRVFAALVDVPHLHERYTQPWRNRYGVDMSVPASYARNVAASETLCREQLVSAPQLWADIDYNLVHREMLSSTLTFAIERDACAHGIAVWFDTELAPGITFTSFPEDGDSIYGQILFPFSAPLPLLAGDRVETTVVATPVGAEYVWTWRARQMRQGSVLADLESSTARAEPIDPSALARGADFHVPMANEEVTAARAVLNAVDGRRSNGDIARDLQARFPGRFSRWEDALAWVTSVLELCSP